MSTYQNIQERAEKGYPSHKDSWMEAIRELQRAAYIKGASEERELMSNQWVSVDLEADVADTNLQHFEQYFIVLAENGRVIQALFCDWETDGIDNTWVINDVEYPLSYATHYQPVVYPSSPVIKKG